MENKFGPYLQAIEGELRKQISRITQPYTQPFYEMLSFHMGWSGEGSGTTTGGKRLRPLLLLLVVQACQSDWQNALPAAAAIELVHNFSLVHDDIQDQSENRRGKPTIWKKWGIPMAINVGDALFVLSNLALIESVRDHSMEVVVKAAAILQNSCLDLTRGQYLDMSFENQAQVSLEEYWQMIDGKTASLIAASTNIGAVLGGAAEAVQEAFRLFGYHLGRAFQIQDDVLGIWGDEGVTGKPAAGDLIVGKKTLPVVYGLTSKGRFHTNWKPGKITLEEAISQTKNLAEDGAYEYAREKIHMETGKATYYLDQARPEGEAGEALYDLAAKLINRIK